MSGQSITSILHTPQDVSYIHVMASKGAVNHRNISVLQSNLTLSEKGNYGACAKVIEIS